MAVSLQDVERQKQALFEKHPELKDLHVVPFCDSGLSYQELSDFIEKCWRHDYGDQARISFCPESLEFIIGPLESNRSSRISMIRDEMVGLVLVIETGFSYQGQIFRAYTGTALSTHPKYRGIGISQSLYFAFVNNVFEGKSALGFVWLDVRHSWAGSSYSTYGGDPSKVRYKKIIKFYGRAIDFQKSAAAGKLDAIEKLGIRTAALMFPSKIDLPKRFELMIGSPESAKEYAAFIHEFQGHNDIKRHFSEEELARRITFSQGRVSGAALAVSGGGG